MTASRGHSPSKKKKKSPNLWYTLSVTVTVLSKSIKSWIKNRNILFLFKNITVLEKRNAGGVKKEWRKNNDNMHKD